MSASREKKLRQENIGQPDPKAIREAQQRKSEKRSNALYGTIAAVLVVIILASLVWRSNIFSRSNTATAAVIDGEKYTAAEVNFYYQNAYRNFYNNNNYYIAYGLLSLNPNADLKTQNLSENDASMLGMEAGGTWHDFFVEQGLNQMAAVQNGLKKAQEEGFTYPASVQAQYQESMESLKSAATASGVSVSQYLANIFGSTMTEEVYGEQLNRMLQYDAYTQAYYDSLVYDDATLNAAYESDRNSYDKVAYEAVTITGAAESTKDADGNTVEATDEEKEAAKAAAKAAADNMLAAYQAGEKLETLANGNEKATYVDNDGVSYSGNVLTEWLFNEDRKDGDSAVLESGSTYYVAVFHDRFRDEYPTIDVRHILIQPAAGTLAEGDEGYEDEQTRLNADAEAQAEQILADWQAGEATEDSFAALAVENSTDTGSKYDGGLYTQVYQGQMVDTFNDWCFDASRQPGDTGIVETTYGYHVMYFVGKDMPYWQSQIASVLKDQDYAEWVQSFTADSSIEQNNSGMKYVG